MTNLLWFVLSLLPLQSYQQMSFRLQMVNAIQAVTDDEHEQRLLASIAKWETGFSERLAAPYCRCRKYECDGGKAKGSWQIIPRNSEERAALCVSLEGDARIALARLRESMGACGQGPEGLSIYAAGSCTSRAGRRLSRQRWVE